MFLANFSSLRYRERGRSALNFKKNPTQLVTFPELVTTPRRMKIYAVLTSSVYFSCSLLFAAPSGRTVDLSPAHWPQVERERLEKQESTSWCPAVARTIKTRDGLISSTVSPVSVYAGVQTLKQGGTAADAAATVAITEITRQLGSVVSYAGIFTMLYYDAKSAKVYSLDAGYNSYLHETDPLTIPTGDLGPLNASAKPAETGAKGRETLVPGFMAGVESMQKRFGRLAFKDVFSPAIWYADNGVSVSPILHGFFAMRAGAFARTPEGKAFLQQGTGSAQPKAGDLFLQPELAATLRAVSEQGSQYMYRGKWAEDFVRVVQREGGKVVVEDLQRYQPSWNEPYKATAFGNTIYVNGAPHYGAFALIAGLHLETRPILVGRQNTDRFLPNQSSRRAGAAT
jgi:gamma-glutamyltranspeptidase/glutathione hydrolase